MELKIVKSHANTVTFMFTAKIPITQVTPSRGRSMIDDLIIDLIDKNDVHLWLFLWVVMRQNLHLTLQGQASSLDQSFPHFYCSCSSQD